MKINSTIQRNDFNEPQLKEAINTLNKVARTLFWQGVPFALHGKLKHRWRISRWYERWQYAKPLAIVPWRRDWSILDFCGAASLPVYHFALEGCNLTTTSQDADLVECTRKFSEERSLSLAVIERSIADDYLADNCEADWIICHSVLETFSKETQIQICKKFSSLLKPGGIVTITFQYGEDAILPHAPHNVSAVQEWIAESGLTVWQETEFVDTHERFILDGRKPDRLFTMGSLFLVK